MNKVILMGRLTKDPELSFTQAKNTAMCRFTLAVDRRFQKEDGEKQADFIQVLAWSKLAEFTSKYFSKGQKVVVVGSIQTSNWTDDDGKKHYKTEVVIDEAYFAESKRESHGDAYEPETKTTSENSNKQEYDFDEEDDGLPF
jgi:single-strand DNA-binding protein